MNSSDAYDDLQYYLRRIRSNKTEPFEVKDKRASFYRGLNNYVKRCNYYLKVSASIGLTLFILFSILQIFNNSLFLMEASFYLLVTSILVKIFGVLIDLETRFLQYIVVIFISLLFTFSEPAFYSLYWSIALFYLLFISLSRCVKLKAKLSQLDMMIKRSGGFGPYLNEKESRLLSLHEELCINAFDDPLYRRCFSVTSYKKRRVVTAIPAPETDDYLPPESTVRVEIWKRDPWRDLSSIKEFFTCCFLGGSQDSGIFDFMMSKSLSMLDMVSSKGRTIRVLLMACIQKENRKPILVVNAVFGREGGLIGSINDDNRFIRDQIEAYARYVGFECVLYNVTPTNKRPGLFVDFIKSDVGGDPKRFNCRLTSTKDPLKLEIFNRKRPGGNLYLTLFLEIMGITDNYAVRGKILAYSVDLKMSSLSYLLNENVLKLDIENYESVVSRGITFKISTPIKGEVVQILLTEFFNIFPEIDGSGLPDKIKISMADTSPHLSAGAAVKGYLLLHNSVSSIEKHYWRDLITGLIICKSLLQNLHPRYSEELVFTLTDTAIRGLNEKVLGDLVYLNQLSESIKRNQTDSLIVSLIERALQWRYSIAKVFKRKEIFLYITEKGGSEGDSFSLAKTFFHEKLKTYKGFREEYLKGLDNHERPIVYGIIIKEIGHIVDELITIDKIPVMFPIEEFREIEDSVSHFEKMARKFKLPLSSESTDKAAAILQRCKLLSRLSEIENMVIKYQIEKARDALIKIRDSEHVWKSDPEVSRKIKGIKNKLVFAPLNKITEKLNMDQHF